MWIRLLLNALLASGALQRLQAVFTLEADISSIWCEDDVTYLLCVWRFLRDNNCQSSSSLINDSLKCTCNYCVDGSIWRFEFPKVVLARISGEVGTLYTVLLSVDSGTPLPIFIQICSYLADMEQEISWHFFYWDTVCIYLTNMRKNAWFLM